ncbi:MAG: hypothetical protein JXL84_09250 [Deltaproteobacteria bacterium]|nr:hypothetical protein [Deltaproteobacteria bacterium]
MERDRSDFVDMVGAIGWPGERPGAVVILGKHRRRDPVKGAHHLEVVAELIDSDMGTLLRTAVSMWRVHFPSAFVGDTDNLAALELLYDMALSWRAVDFHISPGYFSHLPDGFSYLVNALKRFLMAGLILFPQRSVLPALVQEMQPEQAYRSKLTDFPLVSALAMAAIELNPFNEDRQRPSETADSDYNALEYGRVEG